MEAIISPMSKRRAGSISVRCTSPGATLALARLSMPSHKPGAGCRPSPAEPASREKVSISTGAPAYGLVGATAPKLTSGIADDSSDEECSFRFSDIGILDGLLSMIF